MKGRIIVTAGVLGTLLAAPAFAEQDGLATAIESKFRAQAQVELLPMGSGKTTSGGTSVSADTAVAYGVTAMFDTAITPYLSIGVAPRLVLNVKSDDHMGDAAKEIDLRARVVGHVPVMPGLEAYASLSPGYTIVTSERDGVDAATGFAIAGALGLTYDLSPRMFVGGEVGYQRAFTSTSTMIAGQKLTADLDLSYMHLGIGAGTRF